MKTSIIATTVLIGSFLTGCSVQNDKTQFQGLGLTYQSDIKKLDNGDYLTEVEAAPAAGRIQGAVGTANKKASDFCRVQNKSMKEVKTDIDTHLLVNGVARLTFKCV
ncbi:lipoprotein [bacteria symbiont BFo1 of Frankliniella occidentalis]|jgi:hypothetical protein|uniref:Lipoprotein n=1 Tax=Erwinia aphidicola TaxID=68334 RepID=A0ABU8DJ35_ERWAP|nr:hypothetical protein [Erwinia aphidicola]KMV70182.1 hypothetical protein AI28_23170 [bacteria symbiont BFo1 of Frankliniella occidentalis]PIJ57371.1 hypothetical protein BOM23_13710 [Erwinia sp. OLMDLW33]KYP84445.1 lipoprotein [bacteria symbiont BFo1 of Frankliniella occidentalis]KYP89677.1 lipoprotein [bacteria symbiont BFo1 of Frankliniella occidentalis]MBD1377180.1 hypothetical protein [Erwinia aphidicola]